MTELRTERLLLRGLAESDVEDMIEYLNDERYNYYIPEFRYPYTKDDALKYVNESSAEEPVDGALTWGIEYEEKLVGIVNVHHINKKRKNAMIGYSVSFAYAGKGIATEAVLAVIDYAFEQLDIRFLQARVFEGNPASAKVLEKAGFERIGVMPRHTYHREKMLDCAVYGLPKAHEE